MASHSFDNTRYTPRPNNIPSSSVSSCRDGDIAIIGFSLLFPQADSTESFWDILVSGRCVASEFPHDRFCNIKHHENGNDHIRTIRPQRASFLHRDIRAFDARFFGMTPEESTGTDPQQRILLETTYHALENAGIPVESLSGSDTAVFTGCFTADYTLNSAKDPEYLPKYAATGMASSMLSNRISTFFGLTGPSMTVDTACSSSLVALDLACQSIRNGQSKIAIVAGCNLLLAPDLFMSLSSLGFLSPDGICHSFDAQANGYGRGEGFGVIIIKDVDLAIQDNDTMRAVIRATGTNQNGRTNLAQPSKEMQKQLIENTYCKAGLDLSQTRYFEAHGTGTATGDPLEAMAIGDTFRPRRNPNDPLVIGALKANIGHLEGAAGIAGVIKTILVLERGVIPPIAGLDNLNESVDADFLNLKFPKTPMSWPRPGLRRASINSFGFGGTNAHVVLDDAFHYLEAHGLVGNHLTTVPCKPELETCGPTYRPVSSTTNIFDERPMLFVWSATDQRATLSMLESYQKRLGMIVDQSTQEDLRALAHTLAKRRSLLPWRAFAVADSIPHLIRQLQTAPTPILSLPKRRAAFVFTGQGAQWAGMGKELISYPIFRESLQEADKFLQTVHSNWKATDILFQRDGCTANINEPRYAQPLCTILQVALVDLLGSFGFHPTVCVGHSSGEIAAAYSVGAISRQSAWKIAYHRGVLSSELAESPAEDHSYAGAMMAVGTSETTLLPYLDDIHRSMGQGVVSIACFNSPNSVTLAGDRSGIQHIQSNLERDGIFCRILNVPVAYHSQYMTSIASEYRRLIGCIEEGKALPYYANMVSSVTGDLISVDELRKPEYWVTNMVSPVTFSDAIQRLYHDSARQLNKKLDLSHRGILKISDIVEIGPHRTLQGAIRDIGRSAAAQSPKISYFSTLVRGKSANSTLLELAGNLHCIGFDVDLASVNSTGGMIHDLHQQIATLPEYPFDHSQQYWSESRISKSMRLPPYPRHELLGTPVADWNPLEPCWRNSIKASASAEWFEGHQINGEILYPAAGMVVMAIEAITQVSKGHAIARYELRDVHFRSTLPIPQNDNAVELQFRLKLSEDASDKSGSWASFSLFSCKTSFVEICRGAIKVALASSDSTINDIERGQQINYINDLIASVKVSHEIELHSEDFYAAFRRNGYQYGTFFQGVQHSLRDACDQATADVLVRSPLLDTLAEDLSVIHPSTLDSILQLAVARDPQGSGNDTVATWLPTYITRLSISVPNSKRIEQGDIIHAYTKRRNMSSRQINSIIYAIDGQQSGWVLEAEGIEATLVTDSVQTNDPPAHPFQARRLCYDLIYRPDLDLIDPELWSRWMQESRQSNLRTLGFYHRLKLFVLASITRVLSQFGQYSIPESKQHLIRHHDWIQRKVSSAMKRPPLGIPQDWMRFTDYLLFQKLRIYLEMHSRLGEAYVNFDRHLVNILRGAEDAEQVLSRETIIREYSTLFSDSNHPLYQYIDAIAHKDPNMKMIGVGTHIGSVAKAILRVLTRQTSNGPFCRFSHFDIGSSSKSEAETIAAEIGTLPKTQIQCFNLEEEPAAQGYEEYSYDLVVAVNVPHSPCPLRNSLRTLRKLLRDGGKLIIIDFSNPDSLVGHSIFGFFPEWWEDEQLLKQHGHYTVEAHWSQQLKGAGFTGVDLNIHNFEPVEDQFPSVFISSTASALGTPGKYELDTKKSVLIISGFNTPSGSPLVKLVSAALRDICTADTFVASFDVIPALQDFESEIIIIVQDGKWLSLQHMDPQQYALFHQIVSRCKYVMWLSEIQPTVDEVPAINLVHGLARTLRMENQGRIFATVGADTSQVAVLPLNIERSLHNFLRGVDTGSYEPELVQIGELLHIPRVYENDELNQKVHELSHKALERRRCFGEQNLQLRVRQPGLLDTLYFEEVPDYGPLASDEIEIEVKAIGINFKDCLVALGRVSEDSIGCECAGTVLKAGSECHLQPDDHVLACAPHTFRGRLRCREILATKIPQGMTFVDASALAANFTTAYHSLVMVARIAPGESVLIHSGAGGTGQAAIQIAKLYGARVFTTVGSLKKKQLLNELYDIPLDHILNSRDLSFAAGVKRLTQNRGVDVVLNSLAGDALIYSWECVAPFGRFIEIGKKDIFSHNRLPMYQFARNVSFSAVDIAAMMLERPEFVRDSLRSVIDLFNSKLLRSPSPVKSFAISQVESAFRHLQSGNSFGKVVVEVNPNETVSAVVKHTSKWQFSSNETFVIAGGLGGQGRSISKWMVSKGARSLVLLSRSGPKDKESISFIQGLKRKGVDVYSPKCDIADAASLDASLSYCKQSMPPIKGCIQAAMDIKDSIFQNMSYESWTASLKPKILGSWNLHQQLPRDLDFFIMFSSVSGIIGSQGQANYAVGNTFQDGLCEYRLIHGEKATSLNLGILTDDGYVAQNQEALIRFSKIKNISTMAESEVISMLEHFCNKSLPVDSKHRQTVLGLEVPADIINRGMEPAAWTHEPMFANLHQMAASTAGANNVDPVRNTGPSLADQINASQSSVVASGILANALANKLSAIISVPREDINLNQALHAYGVDSLIAVELRNWFAKALKVDITVFEILSGATATMLGQAAAEKLRQWD